MRFSNPNKSYLTGFTLIELLLVVVLLGVCAGMILPNFSQTYKTYLLKNSVTDLAYLMRYAQSRAITFDRELRLEFSDDFTSFELKEDVSEDPQTPKFSELKNRFRHNLKIPPGVQVVAQKNMVRFYPDGRIDKVEMSFCQNTSCYIISTKKRRGVVDVLAATQK